MGAPSKKPNIATFRKIANSCGGIYPILPPTSEWIELLSMLGAMMIPSSSRPSKIPANVSSILPKATSANWLPAFQPSKRTRTAKRDLPVGSNVPPKQRSFSLSKHAEKKRGYVERQEVTGADGAELIPPRTLSPEEARQYGLKLNEEY